jgi:hypothetical protein
MACTVGSELNEFFNTYWVMVKKDTYMLVQMSLDIRNNILNTECRLTLATAGSVILEGTCSINGFPLLI